MKKTGIFLSVLSFFFIIINSYNCGSSGGGTSSILPPQTGALTWNSSGDTVTVNTDFPNFNLSATSVFSAGTLTISLTVDSQFASRVVFNPKVWVSNTSEGTFDGTAQYSHTFNAVDYVYFGPEAMPMGTPVTRDIVLTGVAGTADVTMDLALTDDPMLLSRSDYHSGITMIDSGTGVFWGQIDCNAQAYRTLDPSAISDAGTITRDGCGHRNVVVSSDGTTIYSSNKTHPSISKIDTTTFTYTTANLEASANDQAIGNVLYVAMNSTGTRLFALLNNNGHTTASSTTSSGEGTTPKIELLEINPDTLTILNRVTIAESLTNDDFRGRNVDISPVGTRAAVLIDGDQPESGVYLVNLSSFTLIDTDSGTMGIQPIKLDATQVYPKKVIFANNSTLAVAYGGYGSNTTIGTSITVDPDVITLINTSSYVKTDVASIITSLGSDKTSIILGSLKRGPDGNVYWTRMYGDTLGWLKSGGTYTGSELLSVIDPVTSTETTVLPLEVNTYSNNGRRLGAGLVFSPDGNTLFVANGWFGDGDGTTESIVNYDMVTMMRVDFDGDLTDGIIGNSDAKAKLMPINSVFSNHFMAITPF